MSAFAVSIETPESSVFASSPYLPILSCLHRDCVWAEKALS